MSENVQTMYLICKNVPMPKPSSLETTLPPWRRTKHPRIAWDSIEPGDSIYFDDPRSEKGPCRAVAMSAFQHGWSIMSRFEGTGRRLWFRERFDTSP